MPASLKLLIPLVLIAVIVLRFRARLAPALHWPGWRAALPWLLLYLVWMLGSDYFAHWRGPWNFEPWRQAPLVNSVFRVLAVCFAGPAAEELVFRGVIYSYLIDRLKPAGTIFVTALLWALLHYAYSPLVVFIIFVEGLILGAARWRTGSLWVPILLHVGWNLYAIW